MGYETEGIYKSLRSTLDELGYHQALSFDSLYLVKALVGDLIKTTQSLKHYKELSQKTLETCSELEVGIEPYKQDNARLIQECNHLNKKLIAQKDQHTDVQKDFKLKLRQLESVKDELEFTNRETSARLADLERDCLKKNERILELQNVLLKRHPQRPSVCRSKDRGDSVTFESKLKSSLSLDSTAQLLKEADVKTKALRNEVNDLKRKLDDKGYIIDSLQTKVSTRDIEIHRLSSLLEGGRPVGVVIQDHPIPMSFCTCKKKPDSKVNLELERKLKECLRRQHDAMLHALRLSEKNKRLQSRLETLDDKKNHKGNISELHDKITSLTQLIETLKKENQSYVKSVKSKTSMVSQQKETSQLKEKVEDFKIMEKDLMKEIDRLEKENLLQKTHIADLESKLLACLTAKEELGRTNKQNDHPSKASK
ncbi:hypothetical protein M8J77_000256 [Diaphorina citri]|nr:hypothetical protein M8J77_000256 [Diaphorina citri]